MLREVDSWGKVKHWDSSFFMRRREQDLSNNSRCLTYYQKMKMQQNIINSCTGGKETRQITCSASDGIIGNTWVLQLRLQHSSSPAKCAIRLSEVEPRQHCEQKSWPPNYPHIFLAHAQNASSFLFSAFTGFTTLHNTAYMDSDTGMFFAACSDSVEFGTVGRAKRSQ